MRAEPDIQQNLNKSSLLRGQRSKMERLIWQRADRRYTSLPQEYWWSFAFWSYGNKSIWWKSFQGWRAWCLKLSEILLQVLQAPYLSHRCPDENHYWLNSTSFHSVFRTTSPFSVAYSQLRLITRDKKQAHVVLTSLLSFSCSTVQTPARRSMTDGS